MAANGTGSMVFTDNLTADRCSRMNSEVYGAYSYSVICYRNDRMTLHSANG